MEQKQFKVRIEDVESGEIVVKHDTNCFALVTADKEEGDDPRKNEVHSIYGGNCLKSEMIALAEALGKAEKEMQRKVLESMTDDFMRDLGKVSEGEVTE